jgi:endonuclease III
MPARTNPRSAADPPGTDEKRRMVRRLLARMGRGYAEAYGFSVTSNPASLFRLLLLSVLTAGRRDHRQAVTVARALVARGWDSAARMAGTRYEERVQVLREADVGSGAQRLAAALGELASSVVERYHGDLRRLRVEARRDRTAERRLLTRLPGVTDAAVDLFLREVQVIWPEAYPSFDRRSLRAATRLGLGGSAGEVAAVAGAGVERVAWLAGALARVDLDDRYREVRALTGVTPRP